MTLIARLKSTNHGYVIITDSDNDHTNSFLTINEQIIVNQMIFGSENDSNSNKKHKRHLIINYFTLFFNNRLLINISNEYKLINNYQKLHLISQSYETLVPDQFISHIMYVLPINPTIVSENLTHIYDSIHNYGIFQSYNARSSIQVILYGSIKVDDNAFGDYKLCLENISRSDNYGPFNIYGMLYDTEKAYLMTANSGYIFQITECKWTTKNSQTIISGLILIIIIKVKFTF